MIRKRAISLLLVLILAVSAFPALPVQAVSNEEMIWNYFKLQGFTDAAVAGILGNLEAESGYLPNNLENAAARRSGYTDEQFTKAVDNGTISRDQFIKSTKFGVYSNGSYGYGLAQWTYPTRKAGLYDFAKARGVSIADLQMQLDYIMKEIKSSYKSLLIYLSSATDVSDACLKFHNVYEGSADTASMLSRRIDKAKDIYDKYHRAIDHACPSGGFIDVPVSDHWAHDGIDYCVKNDLMNGIDEMLFQPDGTVSRAQLVTILYRVAGSPETEFKGTFTDVPDGQWYSKAIEWAVADGVVNGIGDGKFGPDRSITREQIATILYRYEKEPAVTGNLDKFPDQGKVSTFAENAMIWATREGHINGISTGSVTTLAPQDNATRAQIAAIIMRYLEQ